MMAPSPLGRAAAFLVTLGLCSPAWGQAKPKTADAAKSDPDGEETPPPPPPPPPRPPRNVSPEVLEKARQLFEAGVSAYTTGRYRVAIQAFEQAYELVDRPGLVFSIAQTHRKLYFIDRKPGHVAIAIRNYKQYLRDVPEDGRRADAVEALAQLEPIAGNLEAAGDLVPLDDTPPETRVVVTSPTPGAMVSLDGAAPEVTPFTTILTPGPHQVRVEARGFVAAERNLQIPAEAVTALDIALVGKPGRIRVDGPSGAQVTVDGTIEGILPLAEPVRVEAGAHRVRIALSGHEDHTVDLRLDRGEETALSADMPWTTQRYGAMGLLIGGGGLFALGAGLGTVALVRQAQASSIKSDIDAGQVVCRAGTCAQLDDYNSAVDDRAVFGGTSIGFLLAGMAAGTGGLLLYLFDEPGADTGAPPPDDQGTPTPAPAGPSIELGSLAPVVTPEGGGLYLRGHF